MYKETKMKKYTKSQAELQKFKICNVVTTSSNRDPVETPDM
jgi:hypothetical protein